MKCSFCGRELKAIKSIIRGAGHRCYRRDKEQLKLNFNEVQNDRARQLRDSRNESKDI